MTDTGGWVLTPAHAVLVGWIVSDPADPESFTVGQVIVDGHMLSFTDRDDDWRLSVPSAYELEALPQPPVSASRE